MLSFVRLLVGQNFDPKNPTLQAVTKERFGCGIP